MRVRAQGLERLLASEHVFTVDVRGRALQVQVRMGDTESAQLEIARLSAEQRNRAGIRIALAALELEGQPGRGGRGAGARDRRFCAGAVQRWARAEALLLQAIASDRLGERRAAEEALEATLELAEPDGLILPFMLWPSRELLERHPKHRTAHATLISTILDALAGRSSPAWIECAAAG